ncbi:MAG TPA: alkaline phosphatase family protein [Bryobacteraceae bacterium]|nr:alkaline phosphatase family protein [Bryobacteraceae bacterium]
MRVFRIVMFSCAVAMTSAQNVPQAMSGAYGLPNGWRLTPAGKSIPAEDMVLNTVVAPDGAAVIAMQAGFNPHGLVVIDTKIEEAVQRIPLKSAWYGMAWSPDGKRLYVSGGNADGDRNPTRAPIYVFNYANGRLSTEPSGTLEETIDKSELFWSGVAHHPKKNILYAANRGTGFGTGNIVAFDTGSGKLMGRIPVDLIPYDLVPSEDGRWLYVSNLASQSVSVIDTAALKVVASIAVGENPNQMALSPDGRLFVACSNDDTVTVIDTKTRSVIEKISTTLFPHAPEGSTPNALALDRANNLLYVANADNNDIAVVNVAQRGKTEVLGFIPSGWYPSALAFLPRQQTLYIGNSKGSGSYSNIRGPHSPLPDGPEGKGSIKSLQKGSVEIVSVANLRAELKQFTAKVYQNTPYNDELLVQAKEPREPSIVPSNVGAGSAIKHILYIIKENRTYDQVFGDMQRGNGDARLTIFGRKVTPNQHALADQYVLLDNLYCDGEVSEDGHSWSNAAYATDANEKQWPITYGGHSKSDRNAAYVPSAGNIWDAARRKGLTYRSYGEYATRVSDGTTMEASPNAQGLAGHVAPGFKRMAVRDTENAAEFIREFDQYEKNYDSNDPNKRLPNFMVMALSENHTNGTRPGSYAPVAMVASNDLAVGMIVERVSHSRYWPEMAIFIIEDDAQDGPDHVDAHRTAGLVISPYIRREKVDSTLYTTSSMLRTMELLLGLPPMSQYDAAATPMYASFGTKQDLTPFNSLPPQVDLNAKNTKLAWGAKESQKMDFDDVDRNAPGLLNAIIWKSVKGADSPVPPPVHRYQRVAAN